MTKVCKVTAYLYQYLFRNTVKKLVQILYMNKQKHYVIFTIEITSGSPSLWLALANLKRGPLIVLETIIRWNFRKIVETEKKKASDFSLIRKELNILQLHITWKDISLNFPFHLTTKAIIDRFSVSSKMLLQAHYDQFFSRPWNSFIKKKMLGEIEKLKRCSSQYL